MAGGFIVFAIGKASFSQMQSILGAASHRLPLVLLCGEQRCFLSAFQAVRFSDHRHRECRPVYHHGPQESFGREITAGFNSAAGRRLSILGRNIHRLDLDAMAIQETGRRLDLKRMEAGGAVPWQGGPKAGNPVPRLP